MAPYMGLRGSGLTIAIGLVSGLCFAYGCLRHDKMQNVTNILLIDSSATARVTLVFSSQTTRSAPSSLRLTLSDIQATATSRLF